MVLNWVRGANLGDILLMGERTTIELLDTRLDLESCSMVNSPRLALPYIEENDDQVLYISLINMIS